MSHTIVIFGASGDLTSRKLVPALYRLFIKERLPEHTRVVGFSRTPFTDEAWRGQLAETTRQFTGDDFTSEAWGRFAASLFYTAGDIGQSEDFQSLSKRLSELESDEAATRVYYLSTAPRFYEPAVAGLGAAGLADETHGTRRVVIEKPFGVDLASARKLNEAVHQVFREEQVYRIDHYLGKETVQNILVFRFANTIFEPLWNRNYIEQVEITAAEEVTVGRRGGYYDRAGVLRDMFQNHLLQLLMVTAMEAPLRFAAEPVRNEKVKILEAIRPMERDEIVRNTLRGQYQGYRDEADVADDSQTATYAAVRLCVDNWRWQGVPFFLRSGKAMSCRSTQIVVQFRPPPHMMFDAGAGSPEANRLLIQIQPAEGIQVYFQTKMPDAGMKLRTTDLEFRFDRRYEDALPDAYERLLLDTLAGDASLFARSDEVELAWGIIDPILACWQDSDQPELHIYQPSMWGPEESIPWMRGHGRQWFDTCPVLQ